MQRCESIKNTFLRVFTLFIIIHTFSGIFAPGSLLSNGMCCWAPQNLSLKEDFEGKVISVATAKKEIVIDYKRQDVLFKFDEKLGSKEQEILLLKVKPGDILKGKAMDNNGMFHFEKKGP